MNIIIVDENDHEIGVKPRNIVDKEKLRYRVSALWLTNSEENILLAKRALTKSHHPGKWGPAAAGTVEENETYDINILKEIEEELGVSDITLTVGPKIKNEKEHNYFTQWYIGNTNKKIQEFTMQEEEVAQIKWFAKNELKEALDNHAEDFLPNMKEYFGIFTKLTED